jgi:hypothetical protein
VPNARITFATNASAALMINCGWQFETVRMAKREKQIIR